MWCDLVSLTGDVTATFSVSRMAMSDSIALRTTLVEAGADCGPASGGVLCVDVVDSVAGDPSTTGASDIHYFRSGVWIAASIQRNQFGPPQMMFRDVAAVVFGDLP